MGTTCNLGVLNSWDIDFKTWETGYRGLRRSGTIDGKMRDESTPTVKI